MTRDEAIRLIEKKAKEILKAIDWHPGSLDGSIGDGCEIEGECLWVFWPMDDGETLGIYADEIMAEGRPATADEIAGLVPGYREIQNWIAEIESQIQE